MHPNETLQAAALTLFTPLALAAPSGVCWSIATIAESLRAFDLKLRRPLGDLGQELPMRRFGQP
jgi:hypothetical protein